jgi:hypothetical protein
MRDHFGIAHVTLQPESCSGREHFSTAECSLDTADGRDACIAALEGDGDAVMAHAGHHH